MTENLYKDYDSVITIKRIQASENYHTGKRIFTYECEYPRFVHAELLTHKMLSRSSASSRAIPIDKVIEAVDKTPAHPIHWGANQSGMQASKEVENINAAEVSWEDAKYLAIRSANILKEKGLHKQIVNRVLEPFQKIKVLITATEWQNCFTLRYHPDAQPEICELFRLIKEDQDSREVAIIAANGLHVPYIDRVIHTPNNIEYYSDGSAVTKEEALMISASMCAQVSYRKSDCSIEKAKSIFDRLITSRPVHASPCEHQAICFAPGVFASHLQWMDGITHMDRYGNYWSGNFQGWIQHRQLIQDNYIHG